MGACASLPEGMRGEASSAAAPPPATPKEESLQAELQPTEELIKVEKEENKANEVDETKQGSLGSFLNQPEMTEEKMEANEAQVEALAEPKK